MAELAQVLEKTLSQSKFRNVGCSNSSAYAYTLIADQADQSSALQFLENAQAANFVSYYRLKIIFASFRNCFAARVCSPAERTA